MTTEDRLQNLELHLALIAKALQESLPPEQAEHINTIMRSFMRITEERENDGITDNT